MPHPPTGISHAPTQHTRYTVSALARIASHLNVGGSLLSPLPASCVQYKMFSGTRSGLSPRTVYETYWYVVCSIRRYIVCIRFQVPATQYILCSYLICGFIPDHHRGAPEIPCLHHNLGLSQNPPAGVPSVSVPTGLSRHSHQLQLRLLKKKKDKNKLRTALECIPSTAITIR